MLTHDNHNSVTGIREFARACGAVTEYVPFTSPDLRVGDDAVHAALDRPRPGQPRAPWRAVRSGVGTIYAASARGDWHVLAGDEARFEDGTPSFLHVPDLEFGLSWITGIGIGLIHTRVTCLTGWLLGRLGELRHSNGAPMVRIYGPADTRDRGGTVAFNLLDPVGRLADERAVARDTAAAGISVRTGCFCNPGASEGPSS